MKQATMINTQRLLKQPGVLTVAGIFLILFMITFSSAALAATHTASPGGNSITECLDLSNPGDTIEIEAGVYLESVVVNKAVILVGLDGSANTTVTGPVSDMDVFTVSTDGVDLSGLTIDGGRFGLALGASVSQIQIADCIISETGDAQLQLPPALVSDVVAAVTLVPHASGYYNAVRILDGTISDSTTWSALPAGFSYYLNSATVIVGGSNSPVLTIASGTVIKHWFSDYQIGSDANNPGGVVADNVIFTSIYDDTAGGNTSGNSTPPGKSQWYYLRFQAGAIDGSCEFTNCDFRYGGRSAPVLWSRLGGKFTAGNCAFLTNDQSVLIEGDGESTVTNCTMAPSSHGITVREPATGSAVTGCTITQDSGYPARLPMSKVNSFLNLQGNSIIPNGTNEYDAIGITDSVILDSMTLPVLPHSYVYYLESATITIGGPNSPVLTIPSGTILKHWFSDYQIGSDVNNSGGLVADNAIFTSIYDDTAGGNTSGNEAAPGASNWYYLRFQEGAIDGSCDFTNCDFRYGGRSAPVLWSRLGGTFTAEDCNFMGNTQSALIEGGGESVLTDCTMAPSTHGITVREPSTGVAVTGCVITQDSGYPARLPMSKVDSFLNAQNNSYIPNATGDFAALGITDSVILDSMTLPVLPHGFVYYLDSATITVGGLSNPVLTIPSGTIIKHWFSDYQIGSDINNPGGIVADNVIFTSIYDDTAGGNTSGNNATPGASNWYYLRFQEGAIDGSCDFTDCDFRYGGRSAPVLWSRLGGTFSAVNCDFLGNNQSALVEGGGESVLTNCNMAPTLHGITVREPSTGLAITGCTITQDSGYPARLPMSMVDSFFNVQGNSYIPNGTGEFDAVGITDSSILNSMTLPTLPHSFVYYLESATITVGGPASPVLTIPSGTIIKHWYSDYQIGVDENNPGGLVADNVIFTSIYDDSVGGDTSGNTLAPSSSNWYYMRFQAGAIDGSCQLTNCDVRYGGRSAPVFWSRQGGAFTATNCNLLENNQSLLLEGEGASTLTNCTMEPGANGLTIREPATGAQVTSCSITQGAGYPILIPMNQVDGFLNAQGNSFIPRGDGMYDAVGITNTIITESMTLPVLPHDFVYYLNQSTITIGSLSRPVLTIEPGTIIKQYRSNWSFGQGADSPGGIHAQGAVFTSLYDDTVGGDTSGNGNAPSPGDWYYLQFNEASSVFNCGLFDCDLRYGGRNGLGTIYTRADAGLVLNKVRISKSSSAGIYSTGLGSWPRVYYCELFENVNGIQAVNNARPDITRSCFDNNSDFAITVAEYTDGEGDLFAQECWWGAPGGPVVGSDVSDFVDFSNWSSIATCLDVSDVPAVPMAFEAKAPAPNPFNPSTDIRFALPQSESVKLRIFDVRGNLVKELLSGDLHEPGNHSVTWSGRDDSGRTVPSGVYFYVMEAGSFGARHKMLLLK